MFSFVLFSLLFTGVAMSQGLGFKAGLNMANLSTDQDDFESDSKLGFQVGAFYELAVGEDLTVRPGLLYSGKGANDPDSEGDISLSYLDIPIDLLYKVPVGSNHLGIHAGPYIGILLSADGGGEDIKEFVKSTDFGLNIGLGYELQNIIIDINYGLGLSSIDDSDDLEQSSIKNTNISFTVGYRL
jgi:opacity protein-like surface antigen